MNKSLLPEHIENYQKEKSENPDQFQEDWSERQEHIAKYQGYNEEIGAKASGQNKYGVVYYPI